MTISAVTEKANATLKVCHALISLETEGCLQFIDLTDLLLELVRRSGIRNGLVNIQTRHTTTAIMINENEPLLIQDLKKTLQALAPHDAAYQHDDFDVRTANMCPDEAKNGHSHCKVMFLKASEAANIVEGAVQLGPWQRIFFIELDRARKRTVSVVVMGQPE
jgi:secondary thiamine-phosphate synthase enzyme